MTAAARTTAHQWLAEFGDKLYAYALRRLGGDAALAEDLVQETLLAGLRGYDSFEQKSTVDTWLIGILRRKIVDHFRRAGRRNKEIPLETFFSSHGHIKDVGRWGNDPAELLENREFLDTLDECLRDLSPTLAEAFVACVMDGLDTDQACSVLDITSTNLSVRLHRARLSLRRCLELKWFRED